jgi:hypothetical protein
MECSTNRSAGFIRSGKRACGWIEFELEEVGLGLTLGVRALAQRPVDATQRGV